MKITARVVVTDFNPSRLASQQASLGTALKVGMRWSNRQIMLGKVSHRYESRHGSSTWSNASFVCRQCWVHMLVTFLRLESQVLNVNDIAAAPLPLTKSLATHCNHLPAGELHPGLAKALAFIASVTQHLVSVYLHLISLACRHTDTAMYQVLLSASVYKIYLMITMTGRDRCLTPSSLGFSEPVMCVFIGIQGTPCWFLVLVISS